MEAGTPYPVVLEFEREYEVERGRPLVNWLLAIPHWIIAYFLRLVAQALTVIALFTILFTKAIPSAVFDFIVLAYRYQWRVTAFTLGMQNEYPPFDFEPRAMDDGSAAARLSIPRQDEYRRLMPLVKWFLAIPHYVVLVVLWLGGLAAFLAAIFAVLFTGKYPVGLRNYLVGVGCWTTRVVAYAGLLTDEYPPFRLD